MDSQAGSVAGFMFSNAMANSGIIWDEDTLRAFLIDPRRNIPGNRMAYSGLRDERRLDDLIAYIIQETQ